MDDLIESIRSAVVADASDDVRSLGAQACRTILLALEGKQGDPVAVPIDANASPPAHPEIAALIGGLRGVPVEQLLDLAIARLRAALPQGAAAPHITPVKFQLVPVGQGARR